MLRRSTLSLSSVEGKGSSSPRNGCFKCDGAHFQRDCNASKNAGKGKGNRGKSWSKSDSSTTGKGESKKTMENPSGSPKEPKVRSMFPKAQAKVNRQSGNEYGRVVCS